MTYLYKISKPENITERTPILFTMHGVGSNYHDLSSIPGIEEKGFVQIDVQGNRPYGSGYTYYVPDFSRQTEEEVINGTLDQLDSFFDETIKKEKLSPNQPRYFLGFSQGAILSLSYSLLHPDKSNGAVIMSGRLPDYVAESAKAVVPGAQPAFFVGHGQFDPLFPVHVGQATETYLESKDLSVTYKEYPTAHGVVPDEVIDIRNWLNAQFQS
ncbi:alpha/beta hydrolase [Sporolactobacillus kofuensis]|uniref:Alpha/beta hydrolase n=1 Tax=Sporolactobacillus kofuensis TaxID=269672 RepID=A0ABW1WFW7_9BACL|nr:phospholipase [Sporolactobacillus kofuensis]MCO7175803.1 phospholipase [Sporolactobacillus kofuensis]